MTVVPMFDPSDADGLAKLHDAGVPRGRPSMTSIAPGRGLDRDRDAHAEQEALKSGWRSWAAARARVPPPTIFKAGRQQMHCRIGRMPDRRIA